MQKHFKLMHNVLTSSDSLAQAGETRKVTVTVGLGVLRLWEAHDLDSSHQEKQLHPDKDFCEAGELGLGESLSFEASLSDWTPLSSMKSSSRIHFGL